MLYIQRSDKLGSFRWVEKKLISLVKTRNTDRDRARDP